MGNGRKLPTMSPQTHPKDQSPLPRLNKPSSESFNTVKSQTRILQDQPFERRATKKLDKRLLSQLQQHYSRSLAQPNAKERRNNESDQEDLSFDSNMARRVDKSKLRDFSELELDDERDLFRTKRSILIQHLPVHDTDTTGKHKYRKAKETDPLTTKQSDPAVKKIEKRRDGPSNSKSPPHQQPKEKPLVPLEMKPVVGVKQVRYPGGNQLERNIQETVEGSDASAENTSPEEQARLQKRFSYPRGLKPEPILQSLPFHELPETYSVLEVRSQLNQTPNPARGSRPGVLAKNPIADSAHSSKPPIRFEALRLSCNTSSPLSKVCTIGPMGQAVISSSTSHTPLQIYCRPSEVTPAEPLVSGRQFRKEPNPQLISDHKDGFQGIVDSIQPAVLTETSLVGDLVATGEKPQTDGAFSTVQKSEQREVALAYQTQQEVGQKPSIPVDSRESASLIGPDTTAKSSPQPAAVVENLFPQDGLNSIIQTIQLVIPEKQKRTSKLGLASQEQESVRIKVSTEPEPRSEQQPLRSNMDAQTNRTMAPPIASPGTGSKAGGLGLDELAESQTSAAELEISPKPAEAPGLQSTSSLSHNTSRVKSPRDQIASQPPDHSTGSLKTSKKQERFSVRSGLVGKKLKPYSSESQRDLIAGPKETIREDIRYFKEDRNDSSSERIEVLSRLSDPDDASAMSQSHFRMDFVEDKKFKGIDPGKADQATLDEARRLQAGMEGFKRRGQLLLQKPFQLGAGSEHASKRFPNANDPLAKFKAVKIGNGPYDFIFQSYEDEDHNYGQLVVGFEAEVAHWDEDRFAKLVRIPPDEPAQYDLAAPGPLSRDSQQRPADSDSEGGEEEVDQEIDYHTSEEDEASEKKSVLASSNLNMSQLQLKENFYLCRLIVYDTADGIVGFRGYYRKGEEHFRGKLIGRGSASFVELSLTEVNRLEEVTCEVAGQAIKRLRFSTNKGNSYSSGNNSFDYFSRIYSYSIKKKLVGLITAGFNSNGYLACLSFKLA